MKAILAVLLGGLMLAWPAALNGYPLVFIDTVSYLGQTLFPEWPWDKTAVYGPFLHLFHWRWSLWPALAGQVLILSHLLWLAQRGLRGDATFVAHMLVCFGMAGLTSLPWFATTLMPDVFAGVAPLCLLLLALARDRFSPFEAAWLVLLGAFAVASHLSHLPVALAMVAFVALATRRLAPTLRAALPVVLAAAALMAANAWAFGRPSLSPYGASFLLARLQADGPATATLRADCPRPGWTLCAHLRRLPMDSNTFLWDPGSPLNRTPEGQPIPMGAMRAAPEAAAILLRTLQDRPTEVAEAMARNTLRQAMMTEVGDTLGNLHLAASARRAIALMPAGELAAFDAAAQMRGELPGRAAPYLLLHRPVLVASLVAGLLLLGLTAWRRDGVRAGILAGAAVAVAANAFATGALSVPMDRYGARIVWLLPLVVMLGLLRRFDDGLTDAERIRARLNAWPNSSPPSLSSSLPDS